MVFIKLWEKTYARVWLFGVYRLFYRFPFFNLFRNRQIIDLHEGVYGHLVAQSAWFYIALTAVLLGTQLFLAGFIGDLVSRQSPRRNDYQIEKILK